MRDFDHLAFISANRGAVIVFMMVLSWSIVWMTYVGVNALVSAAPRGVLQALQIGILKLVVPITL